MNNPLRRITIGLGVACLLSGIYWIYQRGEPLEIILPFILGVGLIGSTYIGTEKEKGTSDK